MFNHAEKNGEGCPNEKITRTGTVSTIYIAPVR